MALLNTDLLLKLSTTAGTAGNQNAQADPNASLGKYVSTTQITDNSLHNLFDLVGGTENAAGEAEYRCIFVHNNHATDTWYAAVAWIESEVSGGANTSIGVDPAGPLAVGSSSAQAAQVADENTAPAAVSFTSPASEATGITVGDIPAGQVKAIWIRRTATNSAALTNDGATIRVRGEI